MNEIPKNAQGPSIPQQAQAQVQKTEQVKTETVQDVQTAQQPEVQAKEIKDIPDNPADRSAVKIENDIKIFAANPELAKQALDIAELAEKKYEAAGIEHPELKALAVSRAFVEEFQK